MIPTYWLLVSQWKAAHDAETEKDLVENQSPAVEPAKVLFQKEKAQIASLLDAEPIDRNAIFTLINRLIQARAK